MGVLFYFELVFGLREEGTKIVLLFLVLLLPLLLLFLLLDLSLL